MMAHKIQNCRNDNEELLFGHCFSLEVQNKPEMTQVLLDMKIYMTREPMLVKHSNNSTQTIEYTSTFRFMEKQCYHIVSFVRGMSKQYKMLENILIDSHRCRKKRDLSFSKI